MEKALAVTFCIIWLPFVYLEINITSGGCHKRQKAQAPTPQAPIRNRQTRKVANAKVHNRYTNLT